MRRSSLIVMLVLGSAPSIRCEEISDSTEQQQERAGDPAQNRLFWMSTAKVSAPHQVSLGTFEFLVYQAGYSPTDFFQLNLSATINYWSFGTKLQFVPASGYFQGLAVCADLGFWPQSGTFSFTKDQVQAFTLACSLGDELVQTHVNLMQVYQPNATTRDLPTNVQIGVSAVVKQSRSGGTKLMGEIWFGRDSYTHGFKTGAFVAGARSYSRSFTWELAFVIAPPILAEDAEGLMFYPVPYVSLMWYI